MKCPSLFWSAPLGFGMLGGMTRRRRRLARRTRNAALLGLGVSFLLGCSGADAPSATNQSSSSGPTTMMGGQTGSLVPGCELAPAATEAAVPEGDTAFIVYGEGCPEAESEGTLAVANANGDDVEVKLEPLQGSQDTYVARSTSSLDGGEYQVTLPATDAVLSTSPLGAMEPVILTPNR